MENKQKILYIGPGFMDYDKFIIKELSIKYDVKYIETSYYRNHFQNIYALMSKHKLSKKFIDRLELNRVSNEIKKINSERFDKFLLIYAPGASLNECHLNTIRDFNPQCDFRLYFWDNLLRIDKYDILKKFFSKIFSFDSEDCKKYGFILRPLFYTDSKEAKSSKEYDVFHLGTCHSNRFEIMSKLKKKCDDVNLNSKIMLVCGIRPYIIQFIKDLFHKNKLYKILYPIRVSYPSYLKILDKSKCIIDMQHSSQSGLTIRTIESLAKGIKVITTNKFIKDYEDIPEEMYLIWDESIYKEELRLFLENNINKEFKLSERYSIKSFIEDIII